MELGYLTFPMHPPGSLHHETIQHDLDQIVTLDKLGFQEAWIGEHFTASWENIPSPDLFIAAALGLTENIILGTGVTCLPNHNPFVLANRIAQLDQMAKGRFHWGIGSGGFPSDFEVFGFDHENGENKTMTREALDCILGIWDDPKPGNYKSKWWNFNIPENDDWIGVKYHMLPFQKPHPPIAVAGVSPKSETLYLAGEKGYIPMSINFTPANLLKSHWNSVKEGANKTGKQPNRALWRIAREIYIADTTEQARQEALDGTIARDYTEYFLRTLSKFNMMKIFKSDPLIPDSSITLDYLVDNIWIVGSPDDVEMKIRNLYEEVGGFGVLLAMGHEWQPKDKWLKSMHLLVNNILPRIHDLR